MAKLIDIERERRMRRPAKFCVNVYDARVARFYGNESAGDSVVYCWSKLEVQAVLHRFGGGKVEAL